MAFIKYDAQNRKRVRRLPNTHLRAESKNDQNTDQGKVETRISVNSKYGKFRYIKCGTLKCACELRIL